MPSPETPPSADLSLVQACVAGDDEAWEEFYARYHGLVLGAARRACQRWGVPDAGALAPDVAADLFAHLLADDRRVLATFQGRSSLGGWLRVLTRRRANRYLRKKRPKALDEEFEPAAEDRTPSEIAQASELQSEVRRQLERMAPRDRLALQLFYEGDKSYKEVAEVLELPVNRIGTLLARARAKLGRLLEKD